MDEFATPDPLTAMTPRFGRAARAFAQRFFSDFRLEPAEAERLRALEREGAVIYVMRYASRLDYFLFNWLFLASGLRLSSFASAIRFHYYRPIGEALRIAFRHLFSRSARRDGAGPRVAEAQWVRCIVRSGGSAFLFLRSVELGARFSGRDRALERGRVPLDCLREVVASCFDAEGTGLQQVALVPLVLVWRKGARPRRPFLDLFYGGPERPTDLAKVISFLWNYRNLVVRVGAPIDLDRFVEERRALGIDGIATQVRRSLLIHLRREEKPIVGAPLRSPERVREAVLGDPTVQRAVRQRASEAAEPVERVEREARRALDEISARSSPIVLAILSAVVGALFRRLFVRFEVHGLERIVDAAKLHPLVLVPSHRSHFDYLILSWLFYQNHLVPPHVAAGVNLSFWPLGPIFRRAGAFFLRRSFEGDHLYTMVFRTYVKQLIKDGASQEFFIEGTRSRTGKTLPPRLGMLHMVLEAYDAGVRRDLYVVPVAFTYERVVEEQAIEAERSGAPKQRESVSALIRARSVLRRPFGSFGVVVVRFGDPMAVSAVLGVPTSGEGRDLRAATRSLGFELCRRLDELTTAGPLSVACAALLASPHAGLRAGDLASRARGITDLLGALGVPRTAELVRAASAMSSEEWLAPLLEGGRVKRTVSPRGDVLVVRQEDRRLLDYYRASLIPPLGRPAAIAFALRAGEAGEGDSREALLARASSWLELLRLELFPREGQAREQRLERTLEVLAERGWMCRTAEGRWGETDVGRPWLDLLVAQILPLLEAYRGTFHAVLEAGGRGHRPDLLAAIESHQREALLLGHARFAEGCCPVARANAIAWLCEEGVLRSEGPATRADAHLEPGEGWGSLSVLVGSLDRALEARGP